MALQIEYTTPQGFYCPTAYVRIKSFSGNKENINMDIEIYKDEQARNTNLEPIRYTSLNLEIQNGATLQDMYDVLKTLPQFAGATDC